MYFNKNDVITKKIILNKKNKNPENNKELNIAYGIDKNFLFGCGISITSILLNNKDIDFTFHIFTDYFEDNDLIDFKKLSVDYNTKIIVYIVNCEELKDLPSTKNWSYATYFRFVIADYFYNEIEKLLYLDADIICKGSLVELLTLDLSNTMAAVVTEGEKDWWEKRSIALKDEQIKNGYFNAGFLLINIYRWAEEDISKKAMNLLAKEEVKEKISFLDQDILNMLFVKKVIFISKKYNAQFSINYELKTKKNKEYANTIVDNTVFIHYIGPTKPWHKWSSEYHCTKYFIQAKNHSPWSNSKLLGAKSASQFRYCAKHQFHSGKIVAGLKSYMMYFIKKIF
ncbi:MULTISPECIES: lipopolysaccharide 3-alpha-galactosyltransferase [unclassified Brenneria]|uniref:lipopolysaccharide 3-alpha-galactosyltransferase n=1 Tax=unclassified Brenneria TaxID=2634434 RepID=UPI0015575DD2|nr:lipopolysaccharide 3-alpha-galactosyltransferase [Brenneria sp. hezel4-2-4]MEE3652206.1 lipopolysaccharide 3-alpha-galactosyltransferase [Brenneria sp. HEZEL_4_2_4]NPD02165.1 lipopolysaccharide 3-alpha-galactosyltransferase [Brenneria sp. hezel4-2-4]